jgi:hypothetical protein
MRVDFEDFLKRCEDYRTQGLENGIVYYFRRTSKKFALETDAGGIFVDPDLLVPMPTP